MKVASAVHNLWSTNFIPNYYKFEKCEILCNGQSQAKINVKRYLIVTKSDKKPQIIILIYKSFILIYVCIVIYNNNIEYKNKVYPHVQYKIIPLAKIW